MKTKSIFVAALLVTVATMSAIGKNEPGVTGMAVVASQGSQVVKVIYVGETSGKVKLTIYNDASHVVFSESRNSDGFILPLNFSGLEYGEYSIELIDASGTKVEKFNYQPSTTPTRFHVSQINNEGKFLLSIASSKSSDINVKIYDAQNKLVHNADKVVSKDLAELYSMKDFHGTCTFVVSNGAGESETFNFHRSF